MTDSEPTHVAFVCVQNAGRSQMATAFARRERAQRGADEQSSSSPRSASPHEDAEAQGASSLGSASPRQDAADRIEITTGGTQPADHVHEEVVTVMDEAGFDLSDRTPREVTPEELQTVDYVITMGCSAQDVCPATWNGENRDWGLDDPDGQDLDAVREIRDEIELRVHELFDELLDE
ncbi:Protein-tyrosine-phosphatase [Natronoarchaeum philippinense]|uniref:Protein-tyrosine-phosphatase n=1 Tax=Natronoarchaeum philippinense TaxID=558529 RepID=A0A285NBQ4_NATPI|nr:low molecular weight phosphatase family protein [Natronoarchaeum philippinense]SNZ06367.1 Protein-tyrosine-phosphatase [Natronoarchaeum philippinense]